MEKQEPGFLVKVRKFYTLVCAEAPYGRTCGKEYLMLWAASACARASQQLPAEL